MENSVVIISYVRKRNRTYITNFIHVMKQSHRNNFAQLFIQNILIWSIHRVFDVEEMNMSLHFLFLFFVSYISLPSFFIFLFYFFTFFFYLSSSLLFSSFFSLLLLFSAVQEEGCQRSCVVRCSRNRTRGIPRWISFLSFHPSFLSSPFLSSLPFIPLSFPSIPLSFPFIPLSFLQHQPSSSSSHLLIPFMFPPSPRPLPFIFRSLLSHPFFYIASFLLYNFSPRTSSLIHTSPHFLHILQLRSKKPITSWPVRIILIATPLIPKHMLISKYEYSFYWLLISSYPLLILHVCGQIPWI